MIDSDRIKKEVEERQKNDPSFLERLKKKIKKLRSEDPNIYPMD